MATLRKPEDVSLTGDVVLTPYAPGEDFPLFIQPRDAALQSDPDAAREWFLSNRPALEALLLEAGGLVFRGFAVNDSLAFSRWLEGWKTPRFGYTAGSSPRRKLADRVYESTYVPATDVIMIHQEMSYMPAWPDRIAFYCNVPPVSAGETLVADARRITAAMPRELIDAIDQRGLLYTRNFRDRDASTGNTLLDMIHRPWQEAFSTTDRDKPIDDCKAMGFEAKWLDDGSLSTSYFSRGLIEHPLTGEKLWFNQLATTTMGRESVLGPERVPMYEAYYGDSRPRPFWTTYGDGGRVPEALIDALYDVLNQHSIRFAWSRGDVLLLDNYLAFHGRNRFTGHRDIQVSLLSF